VGAQTALKVAVMLNNCCIWRAGTNWLGRGKPAFGTNKNIFRGLGRIKQARAAGRESFAAPPIPLLGGVAAKLTGWLPQQPRQNL